MRARVRVRVRVRDSHAPRLMTRRVGLCTCAVPHILGRVGVRVRVRARVRVRVGLAFESPKGSRWTAW